MLLKINVKTGEVKIIVNAIGGEHAVNGYRAAVEFHDKLYFAAAAKGQPYLLEVDPNSGDATEIVYRSAAMTTGLEEGLHCWYPWFDRGQQSAYRQHDHR